MLFVNKKCESLYKILNENVVDEEVISESELAKRDWINHGGEYKMSVIDSLLAGNPLELGKKSVEHSIDLKKLLGSDWSDFCKKLQALKASTNNEDVSLFNELILSYPKVAKEINSLSNSLGKRYLNVWLRIFKGNVTGNAAKFPSAEQMETVIAYAFNSLIHGQSGKDNEALKDVDENMKDKFVAYYEDNKLWLNKIANTINIKAQGCGKLYKQPFVKITPTWRDFYNASSDVGVEISGIGVGEDNKKLPKTTPKTDIIDTSNTYRFSFKQSDSSQIISGTKAESQATLRCVLNYCITDNKFKDSTIRKISAQLQEGINDLFSDAPGQTWTPRTKTSEINKEASAIIHKKLTQIVRNVLSTDEQFKYQVLLEALSGRLKFGKNSPATATHILSWNKNGECTIISVEDYAKNHLDNVNIEINFKSSSGVSNTVLRLSTNNNKINKAVADLHEEMVDDALEAIEDNKEA